MKKILYLGLIVSVLSIFCVTISQAAPPFIRSTFNANDEDWTAETGEGEMTYHKKGGNPGGYLSFKDIGGSSYAVFPPDKFKGDLSRFDGGLLSYDILQIIPTTQLQWVGSGFGRMEISDGSRSATFIYAPEPPVPSPEHWTTYSAPMTASAWHTSQADWTSILSHVTSFGLGLDLIPGQDTVGLDNFKIVEADKITANPEPASMLLFTVGGAALALSRRRKSFRF
jgi:hypothetical protein